MKISVVVEVLSGQGTGDRIAVEIGRADVLRVGIERELFSPWHSDAALRLAEVIVEEG